MLKICQVMCSIAAERCAGKYAECLPHARPPSASGLGQFISTAAAGGAISGSHLMSKCLQCLFSLYAEPFGEDNREASSAPAAHLACHYEWRQL